MPDNPTIPPAHQRSWVARCGGFFEPEINRILAHLHVTIVAATLLCVVGILHAQDGPPYPPDYPFGQNGTPEHPNGYDGYPGDHPESPNAPHGGPGGNGFGDGDGGDAYTPTTGNPARPSMPGMRGSGSGQEDTAQCDPQIGNWGNIVRQMLGGVNIDIMPSALAYTPIFDMLQDVAEGDPLLDFMTYGWTDDLGSKIKLGAPISHSSVSHNNIQTYVCFFAQTYSVAMSSALHSKPEQLVLIRSCKSVLVPMQSFQPFRQHP